MFFSDVLNNKIKPRIKNTHNPSTAFFWEPVNSIIKPKLDLNNLPESLLKFSIKTSLFNCIFDNLPNCLEEFETEIYSHQRFQNKSDTGIPDTDTRIPGYLGYKDINNLE